MGIEWVGRGGEAGVCMNDEWRLREGDKSSVRFQNQKVDMRGSKCHRGMYVHLCSPSSQCSLRPFSPHLVVMTRTASISTQYKACLSPLMTTSLSSWGKIRNVA